MTPRQARRILIWMAILAVIGLGVWLYIYTHTYCCAPPGPLTP